MAAAASSGARAALAALSVPALVLGLGPGCRRPKLPPRPDGAAVVFVSPTGEAEVPAVSEVEPNDQPAKAHALVVATAPVAVTATLGTTGGRPDVDLFRIEAPVGDAGAGAALPVEAGAAAPDAGPARPTRIVRIELRPDAALAARLEVLDGAGHAVITAAAAEPGPDHRDPQPGAGGGGAGDPRPTGATPTPAPAPTACSSGQLRWKPARRSSRTGRWRWRTCSCPTERGSDFWAGPATRTGTASPPARSPRGASSRSRSRSHLRWARRSRSSTPGAGRPSS